MTSNKRPLPLGVDNFKKIRENNYCYVDKSLLIKDIINSGTEVTLFTRPRRFGKTLNISMLEYFFDFHCPDSMPLFKGLKIETEEGGKYLKKMNQYPVFFISLKNIAHDSLESFKIDLGQRIAQSIQKFSYLLDSNSLTDSQKNWFSSLISGNAPLHLLKVSLEILCTMLYQHHQKETWILIDEYDAPIHSAFQIGYYNECIAFMRDFYGNGLKGNKYLHKSVLTGILKVAKESIFSGLNNLSVQSVTSSKFTDYFGLTENEIITLLKEYETLDYLTEIKQWYNGYCFGNSLPIYNPWSILNWLDEKPSVFKPYWVNTSSNDLIRSLFFQNKDVFKEYIFKILSGENQLITLQEDLHFPTLLKDCTIQDFFTLLLHAGYLTIKEEYKNQYNCYYLTIPNNEIQSIFKQIITEWLQQVIPKLKTDITNTISNSLKSGDLETFETYFKEVVLQVMSFHDFAKQPESAFHCFTAGFLSWLSYDYEVKSNRETGQGRADIYLIPHDINLPGYIFELKAYKPRVKSRTIPVEGIKRKLNAALLQIEENNYQTEFKTRKIKNVIKIALVFYRKKVWFKTRQD